VVKTEFGTLGTMICNDDTFTDIARANAGLGAEIIADPTWDWADVAQLHARMPRFRAVENGLPIVRAARGGESQLIDARGRIVARHDVLAEPHQVLVADLPLGEGETIYARYGNVFGVVVAILLGVILGVGWLSRLGQEA
jgi:apolipoprotein N-acyltransferase